MRKRKLYEMVRPGRPRNFSTANDLWLDCIEYFKWCESTPMEKEEVKVLSDSGQYAGSKIERVKVKLLRPFTMGGLTVYLNVSPTYFSDVRKNKAAYGEEYSIVLSAVEQVIREQKFAGAAAGLFNANIIARDLGLSEKTEAINYNTVPLTKDEARQIAKDLEDEV